MEDWKKKEIEYEAKEAALYDIHYHSSYLEGHYERHFVKYIKGYAKRQDRILDIGCGTSALEKELLESGFKDITAVDISPEMIAEAKKKFSDDKGVRFLVADGENLPFEDGTFDAVIFSGSLHHFPNLDKVLKEARRVLAPYGNILLKEPNSDHSFSKSSNISTYLMNIMHLIYWMEGYRPIKEEPIHEYHRAFSREELVSDLSKEFLIVDFDSYFPISPFFSKTKSKLFSRLVLLFDHLVIAEGQMFLAVCTTKNLGYKGSDFDALKNAAREKYSQSKSVAVRGLFFVIAGLLSLSARIRLKIKKLAGRL